MKKLTLVAVAIVAVSCATHMAKGKLKNIEIVETKNKQSENFNNVSIALSKKMMNSNHSIKLKDEKLGKIIAKIGFDCEIIRPDLIGSDHLTTLDFTVDIGFKENRMRIESQMEGFNKTIYGLYGSNSNAYLQVADVHGQDEAIKKCFENLKNFIIKGMDEESKNSDW